MATIDIDPGSRPSPEVQAEELLAAHLSDGLKAPVPVAELAESLKLKVVNTPLQSGVSGALIKDGDQYFVAVNSGHHRNRQRFTIAHEIGHYCLEHGLDDHVDREFTVLMRDGNSSTADNALEVAANQFAAALLMPRNLVLRDVMRIGKLNDEDVSRLAFKYQVSELAFQLRLRNLGLLQPF